MGFRYSYRKMVEIFANSGDPDQTWHSAASDLGLLSLPITLLGVSRLQLVNEQNINFSEQNGTSQCLRNDFWPLFLFFIKYIRVGETTDVIFEQSSPFITLVGILWNGIISKIKTCSIVMELNIL